MSPTGGDRVDSASSSCTLATTIAVAVWAATRLFSSRQQLAANYEVSAEARSGTRAGVRGYLLWVFHFFASSFSDGSPSLVYGWAWGAYGRQLRKIWRIETDQLHTGLSLHLGHAIYEQSFSSSKQKPACSVQNRLSFVVLFWSLFNSSRSLPVYICHWMHRNYARDWCFFFLCWHTALNSLSQTMMDEGLTDMLWLTSRLNQSLSWFLYSCSQHPILLD